MSKDELRNMLQSATAEFTQGREITRYAAYPLPERKNAIPRSVNLRAEEYKKYVDGLQPGQ